MEQVPGRTQCAHFYSSGFKLVLAFEAKRALVVDVVQHQLILPFFGVSKPCHLDGTLGTIESI